MCHNYRCSKTDPMTRVSALHHSRISHHPAGTVSVSQSRQTALLRRSRVDLKLKPVNSDDIPPMSQKHTLVLLHNTRTLHHSGVCEGQSEPAGVAPPAEVRSLCATGIQLALVDHTSVTRLNTTARGGDRVRPKMTRC